MTTKPRIKQENCELCESPSYTKMCNSCEKRIRRLTLKNDLVKEMGGQCMCCGYKRCQEALHFHHYKETLNGYEKSDKLSNMIKNKSINKIREEIKLCVLLCANCHTEIHAGYRKIILDKETQLPIKVI